MTSNIDADRWIHYAKNKNRGDMGIFTKSQPKLRIAVVGLGYISQIAVLPAFAKTKNCELTALVSSDVEKLRKLGGQYGVEEDQRYSYERYEDCLRSGAIDAVYIALPNSMHRDFTVAAAHAGIHVLCEKPMAVSSSECVEMIQACRDANVKLMIAYRLHFEEVNMDTVQAILNGEIGEPRMFTAAFAQQVKAGDIRTKSELGGGALYDMGIYCLNASRYFFRSEPTRVIGLVSNPHNDARFDSVDALTGVLLEFGDGRIASFVTGLACGEISTCTIVGDKGVVKLDPAFDFQVELQAELLVDGELKEKMSAKSDHFAAELIKFGEYVLDDKPVEPDGLEGLADIRIMEAILESARTGKAIDLPPFEGLRRPNGNSEMHIRATKPPELLGAEAPSN